MNPIRTSLGLAGLSLLATTLPASAHASISPAQVQPGETTTLTVRSIVERSALTNQRMEILVPRQWRANSCTAPALWSCSLDRRTFTPHTVAVFRPTTPLTTPADIDFSVTVTAPRAGSTYLFRVLQTHADSWVEPWVYEKEPYPAPRVKVGTGTRLANPDGSREDPRCFGPTRQPKDYDTHDGQGTDAKLCSGRTTASRTAGSTPVHALALVRR